MNALKIVTTIALGILLSIFLNNTLAFIFTGSEKIGSDVYVYCSKQFPNPTQFSGSQSAEDLKAYDEANNKRRKCEEENRGKFADQQIREKQAIIIRSVVVLLVLVTIATAIFKRYPFYASSLIGGGILFLITYYLYTSFGGFSSKYELEQASASAVNQLKLTKFILTMVGFIGLSIADILFFEKERNTQHSADHGNQ